MPSDSEKHRFSWRGFRKISAKLPILHASRHVCGIGGHTRTEKCLWRFSLQMHCNGRKSPTVAQVVRKFRSAVDTAPLSADVKLTYLKTLVTGKAKAAIANFAYCGSMYQEALRTLEQKFGQPQEVVGAYLETLSIHLCKNAQFREHL